MVTVDGIARAPSDPDEDRGADFAYGRWQAPYVNAEVENLKQSLHVQLWVYPVVLGEGNLMFDSGRCLPRLVDSAVFSERQAQTRLRDRRRAQVRETSATPRKRRGA